MFYRNYGFQICLSIGVGNLHLGCYCADEEGGTVIISIASISGKLYNNLISTVCGRGAMRKEMIMYED